MYWTFRSEKHQADAMRALLQRANAPALPATLIADTKPSDDFWDITMNLDVLSHGEQIIARLVMDMWNGTGEVELMELFALDHNNMLTVISLLRAMAGPGFAPIDDWIKVNNA